MNVSREYSQKASISQKIGSRLCEAIDFSQNLTLLELLFGVAFLAQSSGLIYLLYLLP